MARRRTTAQKLVNIATTGMPRPVRSVAGSRLGSFLIAIGLPIAIATGIVKISWNGALPSFSVDEQRAEEVGERLRDRAEDLKDDWEERLDRRFHGSETAENDGTHPQRPSGGYDARTPYDHYPSYGAPAAAPAAAPAYGAPGYAAPSYGNPTYGTPSYGAPSYGAPNYGAPAVDDRRAGGATWGNPPAYGSPAAAPAPYGRAPAPYGNPNPSYNDRPPERPVARTQEDLFPRR
ncbi:MAG: hypothetical protein U0935_19955 [Pirellulales bacterium]